MTNCAVFGVIYEVVLCHQTTTEDNVPKNKRFIRRSLVIVQVLASQGDEVALFHALVSTWTVDLLIVSPRLRGSNPYPYGSLTYRNGCKVIIRLYVWLVNPLAEKNVNLYPKFFSPTP